MEIRDLARLVGAVSSSENPGQLADALCASARRLGFASFNFSLLKADPREFMTAPTLTDWEAAALRDYARAGWADRDPLLRHVGSNGSPRSWQAAEWKGDPRNHDYHLYLGCVGVTRGITIPIAERPGRHSALTMLSTGAHEPGPGMMAAAFIIASTARLRMAAFGADTAAGAAGLRRLRTLSLRQREILGWVAMGKTNFEIGIIMGLGKRTVDYHVREILAKLGVGTRTEAVAIYAAH